ncbi:MAG TPA: phosphoribosylpyrophosphate synthetase [Firmicutes bacterium]|nr:phosphoribosylpyrophosphate synthetase [Bacillota bacterium]
MKKNDDLCLLVLDNCRELGEKVNEEIKKIRKTDEDFIVPISMDRFRDGEGKVSIKESIRGKDVYILSDTHNYSITYKMYDFEHHMSPDEHFQDIKRTILAIMGHAKSINVVMPFLYSSRQHRRKSRESLDCAAALQELERIGVKSIITFDAHDPNIQNAVPTMPVDNFYATNDMLKVFLKKEGYDPENMLVVSPDAGAMDRARFLADVLRVDVGMFYKRRDISKIVDGKNPIVAHEYLGRDVEGKTVIVVDDMIASGGSVIEVAEELKKRKANKVFFFATFALFTAGHAIFDEAYEKGLFDAIYATNLNYIPEEILKKDWFVAADCSTYIAKIINSLNNEESIAELIKDNSAITSYRKEKNLYM